MIVTGKILLSARIHPDIQMDVQMRCVVLVYYSTNQIFLFVSRPAYNSTDTILAVYIYDPQLVNDYRK